MKHLRSQIVTSFIMGKKKVKIPPIGTIIEIVWVDSGIGTGRTHSLPNEVELSRFTSYGRLVDINDERIIIVSEFDNKDHESVFTGIQITNIEDIRELRYVKKRTQKRTKK